MKIVLINHSDTKGGSSVAAYRLMVALRHLGHDAQMLVMYKYSDNEFVHEVGSTLHKKFNLYREKIGIMRGNKMHKENAYKISTGTTGLTLHNHPLVVNADVVVLNWINMGMLKLSEIEHIAKLKPTVWIMHDMWPMTGCCHHAYSCDRYLDRCGKCPLLGEETFRDISYATWVRKQLVYERTRIKFVAVSPWAQNKADHSSLLAHLDIPVIPNAFPVEQFGTIPVYSRDQMDLPRSMKTPIIVMGAPRLDQHVKGLPIAIDAVNLLHNRNIHAHLALYGHIHDMELLNDIKMPYTYYGTITDQQSIQSLYANSTVVLSTSLYEAQGLTLIEGISCGCTAVSFGNGGQASIIDHGVNGYIARYLSVGSVAEFIEKAINAPFPRPDQHRSMFDKFAAPNVARRYVELFQEVLDRKKHFKIYAPGEIKDYH